MSDTKKNYCACDFGISATKKGENDFTLNVVSMSYTCTGGRNGTTDCKYFQAHCDECGMCLHRTVGGGCDSIEARAAAIKALER